MIAQLRNPWGRPRFLIVVTWLYLAWALLPVVVAMLFSFNDNRSRTVLDGLSMRWWWGDEYRSLFHHPAYLDAIRHSLELALLDIAIATPLGVALALGLSRWRGRGSRAANLIMLVPLVTPELVMATALLLLFTQVAVVPFALIHLGTTAQVIGQVTVTLPYVVVIVRSRLASIGLRYEEAAADLGAGRVQALRLVLLPLLYPAVVVSLLVVFALSMDNFVVTQYLSSDQPTATIPMYLYADTRVAGTPALNALATLTVMLTLSSVGLAFGIYSLARRRMGRSVPAGAAEPFEPRVREPDVHPPTAQPGRAASGALRVVGLNKRFSETVAVERIDLDIRPGEFFALLGPSGCGKTTFLRMVAGFEPPTSGQILLDGQDQTRVPAHARKVNMVFQDYALFPHLDVFDNVAFGLRRQRLDRAAVRRRVGEALELTQLGGLARRRPANLSGGEQQRVALARALVLRPAILLLDEPLGSLDAKLRRQLQVELKTLQAQVGITFVLVTHDQEEALSMSDRMAVLRSGAIEQVGTPRELYEEPATAFVADFLGAANLLGVHIESLDGEHCRLRMGGVILRAATRPGLRRGAATVMVRPERVILEPRDAVLGPNRLPATVERAMYVGSVIQVTVRLATGETLQASVPNTGGTVAWDPGTAVGAHLPADAVRVLDSATTSL